MSSNVQVEFNTIAYVMQQRNPELLVSVIPEYFSNQELAKMFLLMRRFYVDNGEFIGWDLLRADVSKACKTADKTKFLLSIIDQIQERDISGLTDEMLLQELRDYHKFRLVLRKVEPLVQAVEDKDIDKTLGQLKELYDSVFVDAEYKLEDSEMSSMAGKKVRFEYRKCGIKPIDDRGGLIIGGYTILAAQRKTGKSTLAGMFGLHQYLNEVGSIAYFSYEMGASEVRARIFANYADLDLGLLTSDKLSPQDEKQLILAESTFYCDDMSDLPEFYKKHQKLVREEYFKALFATYPRRSNKFYIIDERMDWDNLFIKMNLMATTKGVKTFIIDYPYLVPRGRAFKELASWEYNLKMSAMLKNFSHQHGLNVITPAQLNEGNKKRGEDPKLKFVSNAINDCDLALYMTNEQEDQTLGTVTVKFEAIRNFISIPGSDFPAPFKLQKHLNKSRFEYMEF